MDKTEVEALLTLIKAADLVTLLIEGKRVALGHDTLEVIIRALERELHVERSSDVDQ